MDELEELKQEYLLALPAKLDLIEQLMKRGDSRSREEVVAILHKIHGTAGSYDLDAIGELAADCEEQLRSGPANTAKAVQWFLKRTRKALLSE